MWKKIESRIQHLKQKKEILSAVHDDDLVSFLKSIGLLGDINSGKAKCKYCKNAITLDNLEAVMPNSGSISYVCDNPKCLGEFMNNVRDI